MTSNLYKDMIDQVVPSDLMMQKIRGKMVAIAEARAIAPGSAQRKTKLRYLLITATAALVLLFILFESSDTQINNSFSINVHALELQRNGSVTLREGSIFESTMTMTGDFFDSEGRFTYSYSNLYQSIYFIIEGENIKHVEFFTDDGDFRKVQYLTENGEFVNSRHGLTTISDKHLGNSFTLDDLGSLTDGYVILAGKPGIATKSFSLTIHVIATFDDNTTQEELLNVYFPLQ